MLGITDYGAFVLCAVMLNLTPGTDTVYVLSRAISGGRKTGAVSALGISTGILVHTVLCASGLSVLLARSAAAFAAVKIVGAVYLAVMGVRTIISKNSLIDCGADCAESAFTAYRRGVLTNVLNPKTALFFLALLPQFVDAQSGFGVLPFFVLGLTFFATSTVWSLILAFGASFLNGFLRRRQNAQKAVTKLSGVIYILLGLNILRAKA